MPGGRKPYSPYTNVQQPGGGHKAQRRQQQHRAKRKKGGGPSGPWGFLALVTAVAGAWFLGVKSTISSRKEKRRESRGALAGLLAKPMSYSEHAKCRMDCRHIPAAEVRAMLQYGQINQKKSELEMSPCPKYVVDAKVGQPSKNVQGVFSGCSGYTSVVTVIDRDKDWTCYCP